MITEKKKEYLKKYTQQPENKKRNALAAKKWRKKNPNFLRDWKERNSDKVKNHERSYRASRRASLNEKAQVYFKEKRLVCLNHYGNNNPKCVCCGERELKFLALDHIDGGGNKHRIGKGNMSVWAIKNDFPPIFQILCHNCNCAKGFYGSCPHKEDLGSQSD